MKTGFPDADHGIVPALFPFAKWQRGRFSSVFFQFPELFCLQLNPVFGTVYLPDNLSHGKILIAAEHTQDRILSRFGKDRGRDPPASDRQADSAALDSHPVGDSSAALLAAGKHRGEIQSDGPSVRALHENGGDLSKSGQG